MPRAWRGQAVVSVALLGALALPGCAWTDPALVSAVPTSLAAADAATVATAMVDLTTRRIPASSGAVRVEAPPGDAVLTPALMGDLRQAGYTVGDNGPHRLAYQVNTLGDDLLVRMDLDGARATRLFSRTASGFSAAGAFTVRESEAAR